MVDDRYAKNRRYIESLSKWVRSDVIHHSNFNFMLAKLEPFIKEMTLQDEENRKIEKETAQYLQHEYSKSNPVNEYENQSRPKADWTSKKSRFAEIDRRKKENASRKRNRGNSKIQYDSDNSSDGSFFSNSGMNENTDKNINNFKNPVKETRETPAIDSTGPKNRSEFFSKSFKQISKSAKLNADAQSPAARLASLASFAVGKSDIQDILRPNASAIKTELYVESNLEKQSVLNATNVPSNIKLNSTIPSNIGPQAEISTDSNINPQTKISTSSNKLTNFSTPLTDITSQNDSNLVNTTSNKKKFKFSPAVKDSTISPSNMGDNGLSTSEGSKSLTSNRFIRGTYNTNYNADSDDDFQ